MPCIFHLLFTRSILKILEHPLILIILLRMIHCSLRLHAFQPILCVYTGSLVAYPTWSPFTFFLMVLKFVYIRFHWLLLSSRGPTFPSPHELHSPVIWYLHSAVFNAELRNWLSSLAHKSVYWNMCLCNKYSSSNFLIRNKIRYSELLFLVIASSLFYRINFTVLLNTAHHILYNLSHIRTKKIL